MKITIYPLLLLGMITLPTNAGTITLPNRIAGPVPGNDNEAIVSSLVSHPVELVGKFDNVTEGLTWDTEGIADDLTLGIIDQGLAFFFASGVMKGTVDEENWDYLVAKSGPNLFLFDRTGLLTYFETNCHSLRHVSLYREVPESSGWMLGVFGAALGVFGWRRRVTLVESSP